MSEDEWEEIRDMLDRMIATTDFYSQVAQQEHSPNCWKLHASCALARVRDLLDGVDEGEY